MPANTVMHLTWILRDGDAEYFLDGKSLGVSAQGVAALLDEIARRVDVEKLIIEAPAGRGAVTGMTEEETYPLYPWYGELMSLLNARNIIVEEAPRFGAS